jgi:galactokinase/mevalonate kinase-like predicted kinase
MLRLFGGGLELTTLAAIPSGSGLGTSSIIGAVSMGVLGRLTGHAITPRELFNAVLQLEQELTTGGGWQDQVGGVVPGVKMITTEPGLVPDPRLHFLPSELIDPRANEGVTLLYYTGIRRLAKDILQTVVGNYLDRDRASMETLRQLRALPPEMAIALSAKDGARFGQLIDLAWQLNKALDPDSTTPAIEAILDSVRGQLLGAKLLGAGGGGFLLIVAKSPDDARALRQRLSTDPPNPRARFFDFAVAQEGLAITVS